MTNELATTTTALAAIPEDKLALLKRTIASGKLSDDQFELFVAAANRLGLDPFAKQVYAVIRAGKMTIQTGIDGFRIIAERTGQYAGQLGPFWCGPDGVWKEVWLSETSPPSAAKVAILRHDFKEPLWGVAVFDSYAQCDRDGNLTNMWSGLGDVMIAKCAEAIAIRRACPAELSGVYTSEEMAQADNPRRGSVANGASHQQVQDAIARDPEELAAAQAADDKHKAESHVIQKKLIVKMKTMRDEAQEADAEIRLLMQTDFDNWLKDNSKAFVDMHRNHQQGLWDWVWKIGSILGMDRGALAISMRQGHTIEGEMA